jgi:tetratricopeptide (TPR) repeat protein
VVAHRASGDLDSAIADYTTSLHYNPHDADAYVNRGLAKRAKQETESAIADYSAALNLDPGNLLAIFNRGLARDLSGDLPGALVDYRQYLAAGGGSTYGDQAQVEGWIRSLETRLNP